MKNTAILLSVLLTYNASAQVCSKRTDNAGNVTKYIGVQIGKDTIVMGVPFKSIDKLDEMISVSVTNNQNFFSFDMRSTEARLLADSINMDNSFVVFTMTNHDTVMVNR